MPDHQQLPEDVKEILRDGSRAEVERLLLTLGADIQSSTPEGTTPGRARRRSSRRPTAPR